MFQVRARVGVSDSVRWLDPRPLFTPKLGVFKLIQSFFSSLTRPTSHYKYNEWLYNVEIGIYYVYSSTQHPDFLVMDGDNFSFKLTFTPRSSVFLPI